MRPRRLKNEINVVPYIDVMLVLLVIFMVTTPMMQTGAVDLPTTGKSSQLPDNPIRVEVKEGGELTVKGPKGDSQIVDRQQLGAALKAMKGADENTAILVAGDKNARYDVILGVLDEIKLHNFTRVGLETTRK